VQHELAERKLIQEVLRESEERLLTVTETAGIGLALVDAQHRYRYLNQTQKDFLRLRPDDLTGQRVADVLGPLYEQSVRQRLERAFRGESVNEQLDLPRANSTELRHCEVRLQLGAYRTEPVVVIVIVDVTERKRAEQALRQSEERFAKAFRANPSALVIFRLHDGRFLDANETYHDLLGYSREELIGHNAQELNIFSDPATRTAMLHKMGEQGSLRNYEINVRTKFDEYRTILLSCEVVELDGEACVLSIGIDITERKRAEAEVRALSIELEQRVIDRTAELTAANKELEAFSYSVSHDLRAPLRAIDGFSRILLEDYIAELPEEAQHYFQLVRDNTQKMGHLVDDLLAFARLSRQPLNKRTTDPLVVINQCLEELRDEQTGRQITIEIGALPACQADPALLKQVWVNLITNALKYTRRRDPTVITIGSQSDGAALVYFIQDNGVGFDMHYSDKLFGVFQRMHRAEDYEGTGVGLAIVQRIVHRHGGRIGAEAVVDQGATFYFSLGDIS
jgi:PAS domain S-box-containing protein